jgi:hypothetical protein
MQGVTQETPPERSETPKIQDPRDQTNILIRNYTVCYPFSNIKSCHAHLGVDYRLREKCHLATKRSIYATPSKWRMENRRSRKRSVFLYAGSAPVLRLDAVIVDLWSLSKGAGSFEQQPANDALDAIRSAIKEHKNVQIVDTQGKDIDEQDVVLEQLGDDSKMKIDGNAEEIAIGITRQQTDRMLKEGGQNHRTVAKPAVLLSEDRAMRHRARVAGVASVAASKIKQFLKPTSTLEPTLGILSSVRNRSRSRSGTRNLPSFGSDKP